MFDFYASLCAEAGETESVITVSALILSGFVLCAVFKKRKRSARVRTLAFGAIALGLSFVLSFLKIPLSAFGGSVTLASFVPLVLFAYYFGAAEGVLFGALYGLFQFLQDPWFVHPAQFAFDYILAFGSVGLAGFVGERAKSRKSGLPVATALACSLRFLMHVVAGTVIVSYWKADSLPIFGSTENMTPVLYSLLYNAVYMIPEIIINVVVSVPVALSGELNGLFAKSAGRKIKETLSAVSTVAPAEKEDGVKNLYLAGGCFWCIASVFYSMEGIIDVVSGYSGGDTENPTYEEVKRQKTDHRETIKIIYDENKISYGEILDVFYNNVDPFDDGGQFIDRGRSYTLAIYYQTEEEKNFVTKYFEEKQKSAERKICIGVEKFKSFFKAEEYHQHYSEKNEQAFEEELISSGRKKGKTDGEKAHGNGRAT